MNAASPTRTPAPPPDRRSPGSMRSSTPTAPRWRACRARSPSATATAASRVRGGGGGGGAGGLGGWGAWGALAPRARCWGTGEGEGAGAALGGARRGGPGGVRRAAAAETPPPPPAPLPRAPRQHPAQPARLRRAVLWRVPHRPQRAAGGRGQRLRRQGEGAGAGQGARPCWGAAQGARPCWGAGGSAPFKRRPAQRAPLPAPSAGSLGPAPAVGRPTSQKPRPGALTPTPTPRPAVAGHGRWGDCDRAAPGQHLCCGGRVARRQHLPLWRDRRRALRQRPRGRALRGEAPLSAAAAAAAAAARRAAVSDGLGGGAVARRRRRRSGVHWGAARGGTPLPPLPVRAALVPFSPPPCS
jgi:hypothetical protein